MFSQTKESKMLWVRGFLFAGWVFIIVSLFHDYFSIDFTRPENLDSPFRLGLKQTEVQGVIIQEKPYSMMARFFWAMVIPLLPLFFMLFGHEAWRRICPLSFASQLPRYLGLQRIQKFFNRRSGSVESTPIVINPNSWLAKNFWFIQFGFLVSGVTARLLFTNSDRTALAVGMIFMISFAAIIGLLFGGKSWCNYFCPIAPVQKIYTQPRGLLESKSHFAPNSLTQSTCRNPSNGQADVSACVGCQSPCPDIDLEKNYWETFSLAGRRLFYYGYFGMVWAFYTYYKLYSGNWNYYFSGAWTHEEDQLQQLTNPGFYFNQTAIPIPKFLAAPLTMVVFIAISILFWTMVEKVYRKIRKKFNTSFNEEELRHHVFIISAFLTINSFYIFGGRPNTNLLPVAGQYLLNGIIFSVTAMWMFRNVRRKQSDWKKEALLPGVIRQLKKVKTDFSKILNGKTVEELTSDEAYILAQAMPEINISASKSNPEQTKTKSLLDQGFKKLEDIYRLNQAINQMNESGEHGHLEWQLVLDCLYFQQQDLIKQCIAIIASGGNQEDWSGLSWGLYNCNELFFNEFINNPHNSEIKEMVAKMPPAIRVQLQSKIQPDKKLLAKYTILDKIYSQKPSNQFNTIETLQTFIQKYPGTVLQAVSLAAMAKFNKKLSIKWIEERSANQKPSWLLAEIQENVKKSNEISDQKQLPYELSVHIKFKEQEGTIRKVSKRRVSFGASSNNDITLASNNLASRHFSVSFFQGIAAIQFMATESGYELYINNIALKQGEQRTLQQGDVVTLELGDDSLTITLNWAQMDLPEHLGYQLVAHNTLKVMNHLFRSSFFGHLNPDLVSELARIAEVRLYDQGTFVFHEGDKSSELFLLIDGQVEVSVKDGEDSLQIDSIPAGETFGELAVFANVPRSATVKASTACEVMVIDGLSFMDYCGNSAHVSNSFLKLISLRQHQIINKFIQA